MSIEYTNWSETSNTCTEICPPPCGDGPDGDGPDGDGPDEGESDDGRDEGSNMGPDAVCGCDPDGGDGGGGGS